VSSECQFNKGARRRNQSSIIDRDIQRQSVLPTTTARRKRGRCSRLRSASCSRPWRPLLDVGRSKKGHDDFGNVKIRKGGSQTSQTDRRRNSRIINQSNNHQTADHVLMYRSLPVYCMAKLTLPIPRPTSRVLE
jgi:hypothetical protein